MRIIHTSTATGVAYQWPTGFPVWHSPGTVGYAQPRYPNRCQHLAHSCYLDRTSSVESQASSCKQYASGGTYDIYIYKYMLYALYLLHEWLFSYGKLVGKFTIPMDCFGNSSGGMINLFIDSMKYRTVNTVWCLRIPANRARVDARLSHYDTIG